MKKLITVSLILIITLLSALSTHTKILENGMQIVTKENRGNQSAAFYCFVKTGSINEDKYLGAGISHYLEHVVSSGTTSKRSEAEYNQIGKEMGAIVNAYTTTSATAFHIVVDTKYSDTALELLAEQMQFCAFDSFEVAREKEVILKEIVMRSTPVSAKIRRRNSEIVYSNSNQRYPVIGYTNLFKQISRDELRDYYRKRYAPNNMIFVAVGNFDAEEMMTKIENQFVDFPRKQITPAYLPSQSPTVGSHTFTEEFETGIAEVRLTTIIPQSSYTDFFSINAALSLLFDKRTSPIKYELIEKQNLVNQIYGYVSMSPTSKEGTISIVFKTKNVDKIEDIVKIIDDKIDYYVKKGFKEKQITNLVQRFKAYKSLSTPDNEDECNSIGWNMMLYGIIDLDEHYINEFSKLDSKDLQNALAKYIQPKNRTIFSAVPMGTKVNKSIEENKIEKSEITKTEVNESLIVLHKQNSEKPIIRGIINLPFGTNYETKETVGTLKMMVDLLIKGSKKYKSLEISEWFEDHTVRVQNSVSEKNTTFSFKCLKSDYPYLKDLLMDAFNNPLFSEKEIAIYKQNSEAKYLKNSNNPATNHNDFKNAIIYPNHAYMVDSKTKNEIIQNITREDLLRIHDEFFMANKMITTFFGDLTKDEAISYAKRIRKEISKDEIEMPEQEFQFENTGKTYINKYKFEQVNVEINYQAVARSDSDYKVFQVINNILSGGRGRLFQATRGTNNLSYFAYSYYSPKETTGFLRLKSQTSIDKMEELTKVMQGEVAKLLSEPVSQEEIDGAIFESKMMLQSYLDENSLPSFITRYEALGLGYNYFEEEFKQLETVTPEDIQRVAKKYLGTATTLISIPDESVKLMVD